MEKSLVPIVTGPTASGKTAFLINMAAKGCPLEIISADAFQVYRGLDIGTAKAPLSIREKIPHHLLDILPPEASYNAGDFVQQAKAAIADVLARGKLPVVAGGTGMYISSLAYGMFEAPDIAPELKEDLQKRLTNKGIQALYAELAGLDPLAAQRLHPNDYVRVLRALEIFYTTGLSIVEAWEKYRTEPEYNCKIMVVPTERTLLYEEIDRRVLAMMEEGWPEEVRRLLAQGVTEDMPSFRALGYCELAAVVKGEMEMDEAVDVISRKTRNYAKRQNTWFRGMENAHFMSFDGMEKELWRLAQHEG